MRVQEIVLLRLIRVHYNNMLNVRKVLQSENIELPKSSVAVREPPAFLSPSIPHQLLLHA